LTNTYVCMYIRTYVHTYILAYTHTNMHACMHTYIYTYIHTCLIEELRQIVHELETREWKIRFRWEKPMQEQAEVN
jgi:hypothetical protein